MATKTLRKIIKIDEERCDGCGMCIPSCAEGALQIVDGKARLISERYCDGLGACLGECPRGAITIEEREAEQFDEAAAEQHLHETGHADAGLPCGCAASGVERHLHEEGHTEGELPCGCAAAVVTRFERAGAADVAPGAGCSHSMLGHWPVKLTLVPPTASFLQGADVVLAADCVPFAYAGFHHDFLKDHALLIACPKLDDFEGHQRKLTEVLRRSDVKSLTVVHMEVPCCAGLVHMAGEAIQSSGKDIPLREVTVGVSGDLES